ncbi:MAG: efflux RND transporter periplasmic adaptor subunit, partial [Chthoniobacteraceae bacterium]|nr:efflux RND transporter periplasmic adaptor subunit [Chthoniobacteraceae bacterium]
MKKLFLCLLLLAGGLAIWLFRDKAPVSQALDGLVAQVNRFRSSAVNPAPATPKFGEGAPPVPVVAGVVESKDVSLFLNGLGNVQGFNTVTVRPRVDGQLDQVYFAEGMEVQAGQLLAQIDPRPLQAAWDQAVARRKQDEALLSNAQRDLVRDLALLADKAGTAQKADTQKALVEQLEATLRADDAAIEAAAVQLGYASVLSPISGRAGIRLVDAGNIVRAQDATGLVVITQMRPVSVVFTLPEQNLESIRSESDKAPLQVVAVARDNQTTLAEGSLAVIDNQIDPSTGTLRLKATFSNEDLKLWPGQFVNVRLRVAIRKAATVVPAQAVQYGPTGTFLFVINADSEAELRSLRVARIEGGLALLESGLQPGERIV